MQIFGNNKYVVGIEYRTEEGEPRPDTLIIEDDSEEAKKILKGFLFTFDSDTKELIIKEEKKSYPEKEEGQEFENKRKDLRELYKKLKAGSHSKEEGGEALRLTMWFVNELLLKDPAEDPEVTVEVND